MKMYGFDGQKNICGEKVRRLRLKHRISQASLAAKMQTEGVIIEQGAISEIETGKRLVTDFEAKSFARILGVTVDELLSGDEDI